MLNIVQGMTRNSLSRLDQIIFDKYDKDGDGIISTGEYMNFIAVNGVGNVKKVKKREEKQNKGFNLEQFDPQGSINFECNGGFNATKLNIIA